MYKDILLPVDLNDPSSWKKALPTALKMADAFDARMHIMTVAPDFQLPMLSHFFPDNFEESAMDEMNRKLHEFVAENVPADRKVQHIVTDGAVYEAILLMAEKVNADLIIMSSHRPEMRGYLLGPNAARVVRHGKCSVMVVRDN
ncbi:MAG: universal stress protein [Flavobacteriales bacterium]|nr:universal stress protein [Flavobacteriales bacterium]